MKGCLFRCCRCCCCCVVGRFNSPCLLCCTRCAHFLVPFPSLVFSSPLPCLAQVALGEYRDVEVSTSSGEDEEGDYYRVRFTEPDEAGRVRAARVLACMYWWGRERGARAGEGMAWLACSRSQVCRGLLPGLSLGLRCLPCLPA